MATTYTLILILNQFQYIYIFFNFFSFITGKPCPNGGDCRGSKKWSQVSIIFGYFRLHAIDRDPNRVVETSFWKCFKPDACLGTRNPKLEGRYYSEAVNESIQPDGKK